MRELSDAFLAEWGGATSSDTLERELAAACERAVDAWGQPLVERVEFCRYLGQRAPVEVTASAAIERLHTSDLYLACACLHGAAAGLRLFDERLLSRVDQHLVRMAADAHFVEETRQQLRVRLFVPSNGAPARIAQYSGLGPLDGWVRVAAVRVALNLMESRRNHAPSEPLDDDEIVADGDVELDYLRERHRAPLAAALRSAVAGLPPAARALLRFHFVDGLTPGHIGAIYGVHRTTIMRRIADAQKLVLQRVRAEVMRELRVSQAECDNLIDMVQSRLSISLTSLFRSRHP